VSVATDGAQANDESDHPDISWDGRYVVFYTNSTNLAPNDVNHLDDVYIRDRDTDTDGIFDEPGAVSTSLVSVSSSGAMGDNNSYDGHLSPDSRYVVFESSARTLVPGDSYTRDVFVRDLQSQTTQKASVDSVGTGGNDESSSPAVSAGGRFVAFNSDASNLAGSDVNNSTDVFVHDFVTGSTERVSIGPAGVEGDGPSYFPGISGDGRFVAFYSEASNLVTGDTNGVGDIFVRDRSAEVTVRASVSNSGAQADNGSGQPEISYDGRAVSFMSLASNLQPGDSNGLMDIYVRDLMLGRTERATVGAGGIEPDDHSGPSDISADGRYVTFRSLATNLVAGDTNDRSDIFIRDLGQCFAAPWVVPTGDTDCDGFTDVREVFSGTNALITCPATPQANDENPPDVWPADFNDDQLVTGSDVLKFSVGYGSSAPGPPYTVRVDLSGDGLITGADILKLSPYYGKKCTP
jgi:hypothetical protein